MHRLFDLHCHVLPGIDDGCNSCEQAAQLLCESKKQGVAGMIVTPHYYPNESVESFIERRHRSYLSLKNYVLENNVSTPVICTGCEVCFRDGISRETDLYKLCFGMSDYILIELPFSKWDSNVIRELREIRYVRGLIPIVAHIERYMHFQSKKTLKELFEMDILIQMNGEYLLDSKTETKAKKLLQSGVVQVLGSDCHNLTSRPQVLKSAVHTMEKLNIQQNVIKDILQTNKKIFYRSIRMQE